MARDCWIWRYYDLMGMKGLPACEIYGRQSSGDTHVCLNTTDGRRRHGILAKMFVDQGHGTLRLKLGHGVEEDTAIMRAMRRNSRTVTYPRGL
jgi:RecA/RadA recombinase